jgi:hypothetical protein
MKDQMLDGKFIHMVITLLSNSFITSLSMFMISFLDIPNRVQKGKIFYIETFWQHDGHKRKCQLTKRNIIFRPKDQQVISIGILDIIKKYLLTDPFDGAQKIS